MLAWMLIVSEWSEMESIDGFFLMEKMFDVPPTGFDWSNDWLNFPLITFHPFFLKWSSIAVIYFGVCSFIDLSVTFFVNEILMFIAVYCRVCMHLRFTEAVWVSAAEWNSFHTAATRVGFFTTVGFEMKMSNIITFWLEPLSNETHLIFGMIFFLNLSWIAVISSQETII